MQKPARAPGDVARNSKANARSSRLATNNRNAATTDLSSVPLSPRLMQGCGTTLVAELPRNAAQGAGKAKSHKEGQVKKRPEEEADGKAQQHRGPVQRKRSEADVQASRKRITEIRGEYQ